MTTAPMPSRPAPNGLQTPAGAQSAAASSRSASRQSHTSGPLSRQPSQRSHPQGLPPSRSPNLMQIGHRVSDGTGRTPSTTISSRPSSIIRHDAGDTPRRRKIRSQYPRESTENHVEYILVASFHIDRGPVMEHQYPGAISGDEHMLAELMLPDQAHVRNQDWTIFFLHKDAGEEGLDENKENSRRKRRRRRRRERVEQNEDIDAEETSDESSNMSDEDEEEDDNEEDDDYDNVEEPPLVYVLNLVNTKHDTTMKRGAVVKAMAICTRHSFLHIYKPLLLLALEEYFKSPNLDTLESLYNAVNSMDLSLMPRLSVLERNILQASDVKDMFVEKFERMIQQRMAEDGSNNKNLKAPDSPSKSASSKSRAENGLAAPSSSTYNVPRDTHEYETKVIYHGIPVPIKVPTAISAETVGDFSLVKLIQTFSAPHTKDSQPFATHSHLTTGGAYTHPIIVLVNAMLTEKRIIFLGHNRPSGEVAEAVLAACALASGGILRGFTRYAFPYTDLTKIDELLTVPGFIAGVTNPAFANHPEWWDLLCDIPTGRMKISSKIEAAPITEGLRYFQQQNPQYGANSAFPATVSDPTGDQAFMTSILHSIDSRHGETVVRAKWRDWVLKFTRIAAAFEESVYGASALYIESEDPNENVKEASDHGYVWPDEGVKARELAGGVYRIEGWRNTRTYYSFIQDLANQYSQRPLKTLDLHHLHDRLRTQKLSTQASASIYTLLATNVLTYSQVTQLLTVTPESHAGLFYLSLGLFHPDRAVRCATVDLLDRIAAHEAGRHFWANLSRFAKMAVLRIKHDEAASEERARRERDEFGGIDGRLTRGTGRTS